MSTYGCHAPYRAPTYKWLSKQKHPSWHQPYSILNPATVTEYRLKTPLLYRTQFERNTVWEEHKWFHLLLSHSSQLFSRPQTNRDSLLFMPRTSENPSDSNLSLIIKIFAPSVPFNVGCCPKILLASSSGRVNFYSLKCYLLNALTSYL